MEALSVRANCSQLQVDTISQAGRNPTMTSFDMTMGYGFLSLAYKVRAQSVLLMFVAPWTPGSHPSDRQEAKRLKPVVALHLQSRNLHVNQRRLVAKHYQLDS